MRTAHAILLFGIVFGSSNVGCKDCGGGGGAPGPNASASAPAASASVAVSAPASASAARPRAPMIRATGAAGAVFRAVNTIELKDEQRATLEKISADLREGDRGAREASDGGPRLGMKEAHDELVAGIKAGKIDNAKLEPHYAAFEKTAKARQDREAEALNQLHAALEPAQRAALTTNVRATDEKRSAKMKTRDTPDAGQPNQSRIRLERFTRGLDLNPEQQKKVDAMLPKEDRSAALQEEAKKQEALLLTAFEKETFDAKKLEGTGSASKQARAPMDEQVKFFGQLVPILTPEQREKLAKSLGRTPDPAHLRPHRGLGMGDRAHDPSDDDELH
jgi:Spy/CpxP family protein refolding chaperone